MALEDILHRIDLLRDEAESLRPINKERIEKLNAKLRLDWTYHSNAIEGNTLTLNETRVLLQQGIHMGNKLGRHYEEMKLHEDVILALEEIVRSTVPLTETLIRQLHHRLMGDEYYSDAVDSLGNTQKVKGRPGEYKDKANGVKRIVNGKEKFIPFKSPDDVRIEMPELVAWYLDEEQKKELHPVAIAAILHYRFVTLHPFDDGNGRLGRILMNLALMRAGYVPAVVRIEEREAYIRNLAIAQDGGDLNPFIELVAEETLRSMELLVKAAKGEPIEEPEDIDKKIAIWKKSISMNRAPEKNAHFIQKLFEFSLKDMLFLTEEKIKENFGDLFSDIQFSYSFRISNRNYSDHTLSSLGNRLASYSASSLNSIAQHVELREFLNDDINTFSISKSVNVSMQNTYYKAYTFNDKLSSSGEIVFFKKSYSESLNNKEQREVASKIVESVFEEVQSKMRIE